MKILRARNKHNVRYDARIKCTFFYKYIIMLSCIQCIRDLFLSANQSDINESPTLSSVGKTLWRRGIGCRSWMVKGFKLEGEYRHGKHREKLALNSLTFFLMQCNSNDSEKFQWNGYTNRLYSICCDGEEESRGGWMVNNMKVGGEFSHIKDV